MLDELKLELEAETLSGDPKIANNARRLLSIIEAQSVSTKPAIEKTVDFSEKTIPEKTVEVEAPKIQ